MQIHEYLTQTQIGRFFKGEIREHATSHEVGRWLDEYGLRDSRGQPTIEAVLSGLVRKKPSRGNRAFPVTVWHPQIIEMLEQEGHPRANS